MATKLSDPTQLIVTVDEATAISELWARRQKETEGLYSGLSIQEIADSMGIPPGEVEILLRLVRNTPEAETTNQLEKKKKRRRRLLITVAVTFWLAILAGAFVATYALGQRNGGGYAYFPDSYSSYSGEGYQLTMDNGSISQSQDIEDYLPEKLSVEFQGYAVDGASKSTNLKEANLEHGLNEVIQKVLPRTSSYGYASANADLIKALQTGNLDQYSNSIRFDEIVAKVGGKEIRGKLPVNISGDRSLQSGINSDIRRRLRIFANQAWRLSKGKEVTTPKPGPNAP